MSATPPSGYLRPALPADLPALEELEAGCFSDPWSSASLQGLLEAASDLVLVASQGGETVDGYAAFRQAGDEAELLRLGVHQRARRQGLARRLLRAALLGLAERGVASCFLEVRRDNGAARKLYEGLGFRRVGVRHRYYPNGEDALLYRVSVGVLNSLDGDVSLRRRWPAS